MDVETGKLIGGTVEELLLEHEEIHGGKLEVRERTYRGKNELMRCPVMSRTEARRRRSGRSGMASQRALALACVRLLAVRAGLRRASAVGQWYEGDAEKGRRDFRPGRPYL